MKHEWKVNDRDRSEGSLSFTIVHGRKLTGWDRTTQWLEGSLNGIKWIDGLNWTSDEWWSRDRHSSVRHALCLSTFLSSAQSFPPEGSSNIISYLCSGRCTSAQVGFISKINLSSEIFSSPSSSYRESVCECVRKNRVQRQQNRLPIHFKPLRVFWPNTGRSLDEEEEKKKVEKQEVPVFNLKSHFLLNLILFPRWSGKILFSL